MIGKKTQDNLSVKPNSREMQKLKENFPQYFNEHGEFELDIFKDFLKQEDVDISKEGYELKFLGKSYAKYLSSLETETYISPDIEHNSKDENKDSENLYIVGDNIDALKHLLNSYAGKIKCIYIDPPYNTGSDGFVYPDNFQFTSEELSKKIGITEEEAQRILDLAGKSTHSAWLTFMYPRLVLARDLLSEDGVIFISIDDNEQGNLRLICDEIFGEENFLSDIIWNSTKSVTNTALISESHTHNLVYFYNKEYFVKNRSEFRLAEPGDGFKNPDNDPRGPWKADPFQVGGERPNQLYEIINPNTGEIYRPNPGNSWKNDYENFLKLMEDNRIVFGVSGEAGPQRKRFKFEAEERGRVAKTLWTDIETTTNGTSTLKKYFDNVVVFNNPKPVGLLERILELGSNDNSIVLDFFSGSATTADAVMKLNAEHKGNRKYIMVQLPETIEENKPAYKLGYKTIDEVGRARIVKAAEKIKEETNADIDYGYKLYHLQTLEEKTLVELENFEPEIKLITDDMVSIFDNDHASGKDSILATWLSDDGYGLSKSSSPYKLEHYSADLIEKTLYIIDEGLEEEDVMTLVKRIENEELDIARVVVYVHSVRFNVLQELRKNLKVLRNNKNVTLIERF